MDVDKEVFEAYAFYAAVVTVKMMLMSLVTAWSRLLNSFVCLPIVCGNEDSSYHCLPFHHSSTSQSHHFLCWTWYKPLHGLQDHYGIYVIPAQKELSRWKA